MIIRSRRALAMLAAALLWAGAADLAAQTEDDFFNDDGLHEVRLTVSSRDWQTLKDHAEDNTYYPADLVWRGIAVRNVGIRSRGTGTRNGVKPGLRVDVNRYVSHQAFLGLHAFILDNTYADRSLVRESVTMKMFARMEIPAPREAHAKLYVNNEYAGVYTIVEEVDRTFIGRVFGSREGEVERGGYLYEYKWLFPYGFEYLGPRLEAYAPLFEPKTRETDSIANLYSPIEQLFRAINEAQDGDFSAAVGRHLDLGLLMRYVAVETFMNESDGLAGNWSANNFYLYRFRDSERFQFIPWDKDLTFQVADVPVRERLDRNVLIWRAMAVPELWQAYLDALTRCALFAAESDGTGGPGWLEREVDRQVAQITAAAAEDSKFPGSFEDFRSEVAYVLDFARRRPALVGCQVVQFDPSREQRFCP